MSDTGRRLTPAQLLLIVVVSILVLLFVILLAGRLGDGGEDPAADATATASSTSTEDASEPTPTAEPEAEYFSSPSGNIVCAISTDSADCVISSFTYEPVDAASCEEEGAGGHLRVEEAGASMPCEPLVVAGDVPVLDYGQTAAAHGFTCESAESGVTCRHDGSGYGFSVARAAYDLY